MKLLATVVLVALNSVALVSAECCTKSEWRTCVKYVNGVCTEWRCRDGTNVGVTGCCGYGRCNIFCCNCDKVGDYVCRVEGHKLFAREPVEDTMTLDQIAAADADMFNTADTNHNGELSLAEFLAYAGVTEGDKDMVAKFHAFDKDNNGALTANEMRA